MKPDTDVATDRTVDYRKPTIPRLSSSDILQGVKRIIIDHEGVEYTLHLTRQNKLLLTK